MLGLAASAAGAGGDTPTWKDALEASPNRLTAAEEAELAARAASGESALQAPAGTYSPNDAPAGGASDPTSTRTATEPGKAESSDPARDERAPR
jgi:hypothetical protein